MTIDDLARMVAKGFEQTATKEDLKSFAKKGDLDNLEAKLASKMEAGFSDIKDNLIPKLDFEDLEGRVKYVETKLGIESGK